MLSFCLDYAQSSNIFYVGISGVYDVCTVANIKNIRNQNPGQQKSFG
jgi:hypothetical protein